MQWFNQLSRARKIAALVGGLLVLYLCFFGMVAILNRPAKPTPTSVALVPTTTPSPTAGRGPAPTSGRGPAPTQTPATPFTPTPTISRTSTPARAPTATHTLTPTPRPTATRTLTPTWTATATRAPTFTWTPTRTAAPTPIPGAPTPTIAPEAFNAVAVAVRSSDKTGLSVNIRFADGRPKRESWVGVHRQKTDISGNPIKGDRIAEGRTDDSGTVFFAVPPDSYALQLGDYAGYLWGNEYDYQVTAGQTTVVSVILGRLQIEVVDADGRGLSGRWTGVHLQDTDIGGHPIKADRVGETRTANTGSAVYDLTPGMYAVAIGDIAGYPWGEELNYPVVPGQTITIRVQLGRLRIGVRNAEGRGLGGKWVGLYLQEKDLDGNPVRGDRILEGRTDDTGSLTWDVTAGNYAVAIGDIYGSLWGEELNHEIKPAQTTSVLVTLGRLTVGLQDTNGKPVSGRWVGVSFQKEDQNGNIVRGDRFLEDRTDNAGLVSWDITAGHYVVEVEQVGMLLDVPVQSGFETTTDGVAIATREVLAARAASAGPPDIPSPLSVSRQPSDKSGIRINFLYADGAPKRGAWAAIYRQAADVNGNPIRGERLAEGRTDDAGTVFFALPAGTYSVQLGDYIGYAWGHEYDYEVNTGEATVLTVKLGRLQIGVLDPDGKGLGGKWTGIYRQTTDISGNPIRADRIAEARTADTGSVSYDLTPGLYSVGIGDISGYPWGDELNHIVAPGQTSRVLVQLGRLTVGVRDADGRGLAGRWVGVHLQRTDLNGNPIFGDRILEGRTASTGAVTWNLTAGKYAVAIGDIAGNLWGDPFNHEVTAGQTTTILLTLGRLTVGLKDADGKPLRGRWVGVYYQKTGPGGTGKGDRFLEGRTDDTGVVRWDLTAGRYVVEVEGMGILSDVPVESGKNTMTDGKTVSVK